LKDKGYQVTYIDSPQPGSDIRQFMKTLSADTVHAIDPVDNYLERRLREGCQKRGIKLQLYDAPSFINTREGLTQFFKPTKKKFFQTEFYKQQRKQLDILMDPEGKPKGGKWTFDAENRKKYPKKKTPPAIHYPSGDPVYQEAIEYVEKNFPDNPGKLTTTPLYPYTFTGAKSWLNQFLENRFYAFGDYEDALVDQASILHHSVLSPQINTGLLTPQYVVDAILEYAAQHNIAINNTEGIIRQIIGWREFIRGIYEVKGTEERNRNFWGFSRKIPDSFYTGTTGVAPVDITIKKLLDTGYNHHIERLMVLGNFMLLCEFDPDEVYRWFMEMYIDAYDWVMVPNVYGMSQFADGGLMSTKPYISGSNYLNKMSNFYKGPWQQTWDGLFWRFIYKHKAFFSKNPRTSMLVHSFNRMADEKRNAHLENAERFLQTL
ncbi:MAG: cryptochrome/photolyase family protein, partial [Saprospiraceae bacterium]|nr:cryptochrome/photolyase family protein [Saprospiraceae bacterium]